MNLTEAVNHWIISAEENLKTAEALFQTKRYAACLFYCHLFLEKILKAHIVKNTKENPPYSHKLEDLTQLTKLSFSKKQLILLAEVTKFNIQARYDNIKLDLHKKANKKYTAYYLEKCKELFTWLKKEL